MKGFIVDIEKETLENTYFRKVLYTAKHSQLVVMSIPPGEDIGEETHELDQFIRIEQGQATAILNDAETQVPLNGAIIIPHGTKHNIVNSGTEDLKLYSVYSPPEHRDGVVHQTKEDALKSEEHFDGNTTESI